MTCSGPGLRKLGGRWKRSWLWGACGKLGAGAPAGAERVALGTGDHGPDAECDRVVYGADGEVCRCRSGAGSSEPPVRSRVHAAPRPRELAESVVPDTMPDD